MTTVLPDVKKCSKGIVFRATLDNKSSSLPSLVWFIKIYPQDNKSSGLPSLVWFIEIYLLGNKSSGLPSLVWFIEMYPQDNKSSGLPSLVWFIEIYPQGLKKRTANSRARSRSHFSSPLSEGVSWHQAELSWISNCEVKSVTSLWDHNELTRWAHRRPTWKHRWDPR